MSPRTASPNATPRSRLLAVVVGLLVLAGIAGGLVLRPASDGGSTTAAPTTAAPTTASAAPEPGSYGTSVLEPSTEAPTDVPQTVLAAVPGRPEALAPVALDQPVDSSDGVTVRLVDIKAITAEAHGAGETSGPALVLIVELTNNTGAAVPLDTVAVNMYLGADGAPATRLHADSGTPFSGILAAGGSARAVYAFSVPTDQRDVVTVTVGHNPESGTAVFSGSVA